MAGSAAVLVGGRGRVLVRRERAAAVGPRRGARRPPGPRPRAFELQRRAARSRALLASQNGSKTRARAAVLLEGRRRRLVEGLSGAGGRASRPHSAVGKAPRRRDLKLVATEGGCAFADAGRS